MKSTFLLTLLACLSASNVFGANLTTADRASYMITLNRNLSEPQLDACLEKICGLSGSRGIRECEIVSKAGRIVAAGLTNGAARKVGALSCVKSLRLERFDFQN